MRIRPIQNKIIVTPDTIANKHGIITSQKVETGTVYSIGSEVKEIKVGDKVRFYGYFNEFDIDGQKAVLLGYDNIIGIYD